MTYKKVYKIALGITRMALFGLFCHFLYSIFGMGVLFIFIGIALAFGLLYLLGICIAAGLENKFGEFDRFVQRKPRLLPQNQKSLPCK